MIHSLLTNRKHIIEVGMTEGSDEQDLVKALDSVADAASNVGGVPASSTTTETLNPTASTIPATSGAVDSPFPSIFPASSSDNQLSPSTTLNPPIPGPLLDSNEASTPTVPSLPPDSFGSTSPVTPEVPEIPSMPTIPEQPTTPSETSTPAFGPAPAVTSETSELTMPALPPEPAVPETTTEKSTPTPTEAPTVTSESVIPTTTPTEPVTPLESVKPAENNGPLASIKKDALVELRPLVDKLNISPEEKFDTLLLLIRSTDDSTLIEPAYEAAKSISDETRRAEALLDIVKEIDYLTRQKTDES